MSFSFGQLARRGASDTGQTDLLSMSDEELDALIASRTDFGFDPETAIAFQPPSLPQGFVDAVAGFGDGVFNAVTFGFGDLNGIRRSIGIDGGVNQGSAIYRGGRIAGNVQGGLTNFGVGLRATAGFAAGRRGHFLFNSNRFFRVGPGRMPRNGGLPPGPKVPRASIGRGPGNPHIDLRIRPFDR